MTSAPSVPAPKLLEIPDGYKLALVPDRPPERVSDALIRWRQHVESRVERGALSAQSLALYLRVSECFREMTGHLMLHELGPSHFWDLMQRWGSRSWPTIGSALRVCLRWLGHPEVIPPQGEWWQRPEPKAWRPEDYSHGFEALLEGYRRARGAGGPVQVPLAALLAAVTGLRRGEVATLQRARCAPSEMVVTGKTGTRRVPCTATARHIIDASPKGSRWVFPSPRDVARHIHPCSITGWVSKAGQRAGLDEVAARALRQNLGPHMFRSWYASELHRRGTPIREGMALLGHRRVETHMLYLCQDPQRMSEDAEALARALSAGQLELL